MEIVIHRIDRTPTIIMKNDVVKCTNPQSATLTHRIVIFTKIYAFFYFNAILALLGKINLLGAIFVNGIKNFSKQIIYLFETEQLKAVICSVRIKK